MKKHLTLSFLILCLGLTAAKADAATMEGLQFEDQAKLASRELKLNGLGIRSIFVFKAYVAGLYLSEKASTSQEALKQSGPIRLQMRMLMEISANDIKKALIDGMKKNVTEAEWQAMQDRVTQFARTIDAVGTARVGDTITLDYVPERGMTLAINDVGKGTPIRGQDFYNAMLAIFVGDDPVDTRLKRGLLGLLKP